MILGKLINKCEYFVEVSCHDLQSQRVNPSSSSIIKINTTNSSERLVTIYQATKASVSKIWCFSCVEFHVIFHKREAEGTNSRIVLSVADKR